MDNKHYTTMKTISQEITLKKLKSILGTPEDGYVEDTLLMQNLESLSILKSFQEPCRMNGYLAIYCINGGFTAEINLSTVKVSEQSLLVIVPGTLFRITHTENENVTAYVIAISDQFTSSIHFDFMKLFNDSLSMMDNPAIKVTKEDFSILNNYYMVASSLIKMNMKENMDAIWYLVSSIFSYLGGLWTRRLAENDHAPLTRQSARSKAIFNIFINLVTQHYDTHRNMAFYADKLCLTPKYLSKIVKEVSGKSAPDWIDAYVIMEAKNMLKYSTTPIKEIVFKLNFPNQSVFYKFFKAHTGMTPSEYRNS